MTILDTDTLPMWQAQLGVTHPIAGVGAGLRGLLARPAWNVRLDRLRRRECAPGRRQGRGVQQAWRPAAGRRLVPVAGLAIEHRHG